ncbi:MAG: WbqC family protein [Lewinella sp.]
MRCLAYHPAAIPNSLFTTTTAYFPPTAWFLRALQAGRWQWEAHENYQKGGWRNRCRITTANGPLLLSLPLQGGKHQQMPVREVMISHTTDWQRQHEQAIRSAYGRAPYFEFYAEDLFQVTRAPAERLYAYNWQIASTIIQLLQLPVELTETEHFGGASAGKMKIATGTPPYPQAFSDRYGFVDDLSILDALFCVGPELTTLLHQR